MIQRSATAELSPADYQRLAREVDSVQVNKAGVYVLSSFSAQFFAPYLTVETFQLGLPLSISVAPFMQFEQFIQDPDSPLANSLTRVVMLLMRPEDIDAELYRGHALATDSATRLASHRERLVGIAQSIRARSDATILVANAAPPPSTLDNAHLVSAIHEHNQMLSDAVSEVRSCYIADWAGAVAAYGSRRFVDQRLWYLGRIACGHSASVAIAQRLARQLAALFLPRAKCVVVDLDNTLWGGAVGDEGLSGIELGGDYPGNAYRDLQYTLKGLLDRGIVLALASKNHEAVAREVFETHPEMVLRWEDFACHRVNWEPKSENVRAIARELNLGTDSLVFLDDDPVECGEMRRELPEVKTVCLGRDPWRFKEKIAEIPELDRVVITDEDHARANMYRQDVQRKAAARSVSSSHDFLQSLVMEASVSLCDERNLARVAQLIGKTNQFNLTTRRHGMESIRRMALSADCRVACLRLRDMYGDLGLVSVAILAKESDRDWRIDSFLMSCRVMGRGVEDAFLSYLADLVRGSEGTRLIGEYVSSAKNGIVRSFYRDRGFAALDSQAEVERAVIDLERGALQWPAHILRSGTEG